MTDTSTALMLVRTFFSLAVILGMIWAAARFFRSRGRTNVDPTAIDVVARRSIGRRSNLIVVEVGDRRLLVGTTDSSVHLVADLEVTGPPHDAAVPVEVPDCGADQGVGEIIDLPVETLDLTGLHRARPAGRESLVESLRALTVRRT